MSSADFPVPPDAGPGERRASWLELFFDLVFVAAVAALAAQLHDAHSVGGLVVFVGLFVPVWWAWMAYTWYAAAFDDGGVVHRIGMLAGMLAAAAMSAGVAGVTEGDPQVFVVSYACLFGVLAALYVAAWLREPAARRLAGRMVLGYALGAVVWLSSLAFDDGVRPFVWAVGLVLLIATFAYATWAHGATGPSPYDAGHVAERYGLFTLVVLGESVVVTVAGLDTGGSQGAVVVAVLGFVAAAAVWWLYFGVFRAMPVEGGFRGRFVWAQGHLFVFAGIAAAAVGVEFAAEAVAEGAELKLADRLPLAAGLAAYLAAMGTIRAATRAVDRVVALRLGTAAVVLLLGVLGAGLAPLAFVAVVTALVVGETVIERTRLSVPSTVV